MVEGKSDRKYKTNLIYHYRIGTKTIPPNLAKKWREYWLKKENDEPMEPGRAILYELIKRQEKRCDMQDNIRQP